MKTFLLAIAVLTLGLCGCSTTSVKQTWKSPSYQGGPVGKVAVLVMDERDSYRRTIENRFIDLFRERGHGAFVSYEVLNLSDVKADKRAAAERLRQAGGDSVLVVRMVDSATYTRTTRVSGPITSESSDWYSYPFLMGGTDAVWSDLSVTVYLESALFDLKDGQRIWSTVTQTVFKENADRVEQIVPLAAKVYDAMQKDGVIQ